MREESIRSLLKENKTELEILETIYKDLDASLLRFALNTIQAHLKKIHENS